MNNFITLNSGDYTANINPFGAEICSVIHKPTETEFIWQADEAIWPRHAPVLFPFVGRLKNFEYRYNGQTYTIEQHGFARDLDFKIIYQSENSVVLDLNENAHTLQRYPFLFSFKVKYELIANKLNMGFEVLNKGNCTMPVSFGGHPAFNINEPSDAILIFENDPNPPSYMLDENFISTRTKMVTGGNGQIVVDKKTFAGDALIFKNLKSHWVKLQSRSTNKSVKVTIEGWPYLGIWAKPNANFICIEPWQGIADAFDFSGEVLEKEGIVMLAANKNFKKSFDMEFDY